METDINIKNLTKNKKNLKSVDLQGFKNL